MGCRLKTPKLDKFGPKNCPHGFGGTAYLGPQGAALWDLKGQCRGINRQQLFYCFLQFFLPPPYFNNVDNSKLEKSELKRAPVRAFLI